MTPPRALHRIPPEPPKRNTYFFTAPKAIYLLAVNVYKPLEINSSRYHVALERNQKLTCKTK
jgi:hypothetical protein